MNDSGKESYASCIGCEMGFCLHLPLARAFDVGGVTTAHRRYGETIKP